MGIPGRDWQLRQFTFTSGLQTKGDPRVQSPPGLDVARDVEFDDIGGLRTRKPFGLAGNLTWNILGGGTLPATCRRVIANGDELVVMTADTVYTWNDQLAVWCQVGTHLAVATTEATRCATMGDTTDADRAELGNVVVFAWHEGVVLMVAAYDKTTGSVLVPPASLGFANTPRLVVLQTRILLFYQFTSTHQLRVLAIDPANVATSLGTAATNISIINNTPAYDVVQIPGTDTALFAAALNPTTSYLVGKVTAAVAVSTVTKARTSDGAIGVSVDPTAASVQIVRAVANNVLGDLLVVSSLADTFINQAIGTGPGAGIFGQVACAHRSVQNGGQYRCYVFWTYGITSASSGASVTFLSTSNWVDTGGTLGTAATFVPQLALASRAFDRSGSIYVWLAFGQQSGFSTGGGAGTGSAIANLQNNYFLYRDDAFLCAKAGGGAGGGLPDTIAKPLPQVQSLGSGAYVWVGLQRRKIVGGPGTGGGVAGKSTGYASRVIREIAFTFDSNNARRAARLGSTLYIVGGEPLQYDGVGLFEVGFHYAPYYFAASGGAGAITYAYKPGWRWQNATGEKERSTNFAIGGVTNTAPPNLALAGTAPLFVTHKIATAIVDEVWRTIGNPQADAPFYLVTDQNPVNTANPNRYIANDPTATTLPSLTDTEADATASKNEEHPENEGVIENLAPPPASIVIANDTRLFLAGVAGDDRIWYSKQRNDGEIAAFNDALVVPVPPLGGHLTGLALYRETLFAFRATAVYQLGGDGNNNVGGGQNYGPARMISQDVGAVSHETIAVTPEGPIFKSSKGWYLVENGVNARYIGAPVAAFDADTVYSVTVIEAQHQVRILTNARMLVWDYLVNEWGEWTISDGVDACMWRGQHVYLTASGPKQQRTDFTGVGYGADVEISWLKMADLQGAGRVRRFEIAGGWKSTHKVRLRTSYDYERDSAGGWLYRDDVVLTPTMTIAGAIEQLRRGLTRQQLEALKIRISIIGDYNLASFVASTDFTAGGAVATSGTPWAATLQAQVFGSEGNSATVAVYTTSGTNLELRDHQKFDGANWVAAPYTMGIRVGADRTYTIADLEKAILLYSKLVKVLTPDVAPTKTITAASTLHTGPFFGATTTPATGESVGLSGFACEVGVDRGMFRRLPAAQKA